MRMKNVLKKFLGGSALALSIVMALGVFAGMGMDVRAAETIDIKLDSKSTWYLVGKSIETGTQCKVYGLENVLENGLKKRQCDLRTYYFLKDVDTTSLTDYDKLCVYFEENEDNIKYDDIFRSSNSEYIFTVATVDNITKWDIEVAFFEEGEDETYFGLYSVLLTPAKGGTSETPSASEINASSHTHSYSWVTVKEASIGEDGLEEYVCSCGDVQERSTIPASAAIVNGFCNAVKNAPVNGIAEYDSGWWYTMSDYFIRELAKRPDVTTVVTFEYERQMYKMTIPAGVDYTALLADVDYFYGYFYFANAVGATIETIKTAQ